MNTCDPIAFRNIQFGQNSKNTTEDMVEILHNESKMIQMCTHDFCSMFKAIIEEDELLWLWNKNIQQQIPFLKHQEENCVSSSNSSNSLLNISYLIYSNSSGSESHVLAKVYRETFSPCIIEFSDVSKTILTPILTSILLSKGQKVCPSPTQSNTAEIPQFDKSSFYPVQKTLYNKYEVVPSNLLHYKIKNFQKNIKVILRCDGDGNNNELIHLSIRPHDYIYLPTVLSKFDNFRLIITINEKICDYQDFFVIPSQKFLFSSSVSPPSCLSYLNDSNCAWENYYVQFPHFINRDTFIPSLSKNQYITTISNTQKTFQFHVKENNEEEGNIILYNEHTRKSSHHKYTGNFCQIDIPNDFAQEYQTIRLYIYSKSQYPIDDLYFLVLSPTSSVSSPSLLKYNHQRNETSTYGHVATGAHGTIAITNGNCGSGVVLSTPSSPQIHHHHHRHNGFTSNQPLSVPSSPSQVRFHSPIQSPCSLVESGSGSSSSASISIHDDVSNQQHLSNIQKRNPFESLLNPKDDNEISMSNHSTKIIENSNNMLNNEYNPNGESYYNEFNNNLHHPTESNYFLVFL